MSSGDIWEVRRRTLTMTASPIYGAPKRPEMYLLHFELDEEANKLETVGVTGKRVSIIISKP